MSRNLLSSLDQNTSKTIQIRCIEALMLSFTSSESSVPIELREERSQGILKALKDIGVNFNELEIEIDREHKAGIAIPLQLAIHECRVEMVRFLLENGASPNHPFKDGGTALQMAIGLKDAGKVKALLDYGADPNSACDKRIPALLNAIISKDEKSALELLTNEKSKNFVNVSTEDNLVTNLLAFSHLFKLPAVSKVLLERDDLDLSGFFELCFRLKSRVELLDSGKKIGGKPKFEGEEAEESKAINIIDCFLEGIEGKEKELYEELVSFFPSYKPKQALQLAQELLKYDGRLYKGDNTYHDFYIDRAISLVSMAFEDPDCVDAAKEALTILCGKSQAEGHNSINPIHAIRYVFSLVSVNIRETEGTEGILIKELNKFFDFGVSPSIIIPKGTNMRGDVAPSDMSLLDIVSFKSPVLIKFLTDLGVDVNIVKPSNSITPIFYAVTNGNLECVNLLLSLGADVNARDNMSLLSYSIIQGKNNCVELFLNHPKIDINFSSKAHLSALEVALIFNNEAAVSLLVDKKGLEFTRLSQVYKFLHSYSKGDKAKVEDVFLSYLQTKLDEAIKKDENSIKSIIKRFKDLSIPETASKEQQLAFANEMLGINKAIALKHLEYVSNFEMEEESASTTMDATRILIEEYSKELEKNGYKKLYDAVKRAKAQGIDNELVSQLPLIEAISNYEFVSSKKLGKNLGLVKVQRALVEKSLDKQVHDKFQDIISVLKLIDEKYRTESENNLLKVYTEERIEAGKTALELTDKVKALYGQIKGKQGSTKKAEFIQSLKELDGLFGKVSDGISDEAITSIFKVLIKNLKDISSKIIIEKGKAIAGFGEIVNLKILNHPTVIEEKAPEEVGYAVAPTFEEEGGAAVGAPVGTRAEERAKSEIPINIKTLVNFARHFDSNKETDFCKQVKSAIGYVPKPKGERDKYAKQLKEVLEKTYLDGSNPFASIKESFKFIFSREVPGHFIRAFLHASNDETLDLLYREIENEGSVMTGITKASHVAKVAAPVDGVGSMLPSTKAPHDAKVAPHVKSVGSMLPTTVEEGFDELEGVKLSKLSIETLACLRAGNDDGQTGYRDITEAGLKRLIQDLEPKGYSYVEKRGKYVIFTPHCGTIGGHDSHAVDIRAGFEGGAIMAIASFQSLRASLVRDGIIENPFPEGKGGEEGNELLNHLDESEVEACKAAQTFEFQRLAEREAAFLQAPEGAPGGAAAFASAQEDAAPWVAPEGAPGGAAAFAELGDLTQAQEAMDLLVRIRDEIASGNDMSGEIEGLESTFRILRLGEFSQLFAYTERKALTMFSLWDLLTRKIDHLNKVPHEITEARISDEGLNLWNFWSEMEYHDHPSYQGVQVTGGVDDFSDGVSESKGQG